MYVYYEYIERLTKMTINKLTSNGFKIMEEEDQDDFTNRICGHCSKEFDLKDPHYYDEEQGECYCDEECYKKENKEVIKSYQVRIYYDDSCCDFAEDKNGVWDFDKLEDALEIFNNYEKDDEIDKVVLTRTPKITEEECNDLGIEYTIEYVKEK